jgi:two-component system sensor histidine kinase PilS (NtrC family)
MPMPTIRRKLLWLITARAAVISVLLGSAVLIQIKSPGTLPIDAFFFLLAVTFALTVAYSLTIRQAEHSRWLVDLQLAADAVIVAAIVYLTGGVNSYFSTLFALPIIAASTLQLRRGGMMVGTLSSVLYTGVVLAQYFGAPISSIVVVAQDLPPLRVAVFTIGLNVFGFVSVAALTGYLAEGLRRADVQLQRASSELADVQAFSRHVVDSLQSGLATTGLSGVVATFNRAAEAITGLAADQAIGRDAAMVLQLPASLAGLFGPAAGRPKQTRVEYGFSRSDGRQIEVGLSAAPLMTPRGETGFILTFQDVTESRKLEREARVQQRLAAVGEMAAGIAHEIRNPLASMSGSIQILRDELPLTEEQGQLMDIVIRESERLNETIRSFLAYARPQRQSMRHMDVRQVITDTATLLQNSAERAEEHRISVDVPGEAVMLQADEGQIRQIVWNLATNGLRAMPHGGTLTLAVATATGESPHVVISVADEGVGIAPEEIEGIFQPFRGGFERGTGLGLAMVHRIVSDYSGEVKVSSATGAGTTVLVRFPAAAAAAIK